ncbi:MAG: hypothetical protein DLM62_04810, partial [Pseudonocardiales bacterium]
AEPVRACRRARLVPESVGEAFGVFVLGGCLGVVAVGDVLGQVFGEVADAAVGVTAPGDDALGVESLPEPGRMLRLVLGADGVKAPPPRGVTALPCAGLCLFEARPARARLFTRRRL